ncbi:MAG: hypothetical protein CW342_12595 [Thermoactinomycetaceae bacterium]|nr:hypothetical protein [Bacillota bacterium]MBO2533690.1 hypothetical protein [Thermoactinomycetaceae bacterium]
MISIRPSVGKSGGERRFSPVFVGGCAPLGPGEGPFLFGERRGTRLFFGTCGIFPPDFSESFSLLAAGGL